jgi:uncharacterized membrane protein (UPF0127 family)
MKKFFFIIFFSLIFLLGGFFLVIDSGKNETIEKIKSINIAGKEVKVDLALNYEEHKRGLSGRESLKEGEGRLFIFGSEGIYSFWMKDMNFLIDIIWIDKNLKVVYVKENALPESYPESFSPEEKAEYVLEVPAGFSKKNNFKIGDAVVFTYQ